MNNQSFQQNHSLPNEFVDGVCFAKAGIEAWDIFSALYFFEAGLFVLEIASVRTIVHQLEVSVDLEALELKTMRVLSEDLSLCEYTSHVDVFVSHYN